MSISFPARYTFNLILNKEKGTQRVVAVKTCNQKVQIKNIKYTDVKHFSWQNNESVALLGVKEVENEEEFKKYFEEFSSWEIKKEE